VFSDGPGAENLLIPTFPAVVFRSHRVCNWAVFKLSVGGCLVGDDDTVQHIGDQHYLVGGLEHFLFFHILGISSSQLTNSYFQRD
jgi:hypothetical protein